LLATSTKQRWISDAYGNYWGNSNRHRYGFGIFLDYLDLDSDMMVFWILQTDADGMLEI
jgi:hypothetical protein